MREREGKRAKGGGGGSSHDRQGLEPPRLALAEDEDEDEDASSPAARPCANLTELADAAATVTNPEG